jgi:hypothetical protein
MEKNERDIAKKKERKNERGDFMDEFEVWREIKRGPPGSLSGRRVELSSGRS